MICVLALALPLMSCTCRDEEDTGQDESPSPPIASLGQADIVVDGDADHSALAIMMGHAGAVNGETQGILLGARSRRDLELWEDAWAFLFLDGFQDGKDVSVADSTAVLLEGEYLDGMSRTELGDQDGDGFSEIAIFQSNDIYLFFGPVSGSLGPKDVDVVLSKDKAYDYYFQVESAGDVDGDGIDDLLIGDADPSTSANPDTAYLFYGPITTSQQLSSADVVLEEPEHGSLGSGVARLGDVNGDGCEDVLISIYRSYGPANGVFLGPLDAHDSYETADAYLEFSTWISQMGLGNRRFHAAGDVDDDGFDDLLVGLASYSTDSEGAESESVGGAYLLYGPLSGSVGEQDVDITITTKGRERQFGYDAAGLGDVNADGFGDILLSAPEFWVDADTDGYYYDYGYGGAYLFLGPLEPGTLTTDQAALFFKGEEMGDVAGYTVAATGDLDADGVPDFMIGAPMPEDPYDKKEETTEKHGAAYVILGGEDLLERFAME